MFPVSIRFHPTWQTYYYMKTNIKIEWAKNLAKSSAKIVSKL